MSGKDSNDAVAQAHAELAGMRDRVGRMIAERTVPNEPAFTFDGRPPLDLRAYVDAMLAAAWCEAIQAAAVGAEDLIARAYNAGFIEGGREHTSRRGGIPWSDSVMRRNGASAIRALQPPASLASALTEHVKRAVEAEREAIAAWLDSRREAYEDRALCKAGKGDEADMMAAACYETASNFVRARSTP